MNKNRTKRRRAVTAVLAAVAACLLVGTISLVAYCRRPFTDWRPLPPPLVSPTLPVPDDLPPADEIHTGDRRVVARVIIRVCNEFYADHGEYPPYLFGGASELLLAPKIPGQQWNYRNKQNPDPLIAGGYLAAYPKVIPQPELFGYLYDDVHPLLGEIRDKDYWVCMYSTPGDFMTIGLGPALMRTAAKGVPLSKDVVLQADPGADRNKRQFALGGRAVSKCAAFKSLWATPEMRDQRKWQALQCYSPFPQPGWRRIEAEYYPHTFVFNNASLPYFGYQRGEWFGSTEHECWLWFYGSNTWAETVPFDNTEEAGSWQSPHKQLWKDFARYYGPRGLDLLNASTGKLEPDGIPDGICLQYILKYGRLIAISRAEGI